MTPPNKESGRAAHMGGLHKADLAAILRTPIISEKTTRLSENNQIVFRVPVSASKAQIKQAVEVIFSVEVAAVNALRQRGKVKRFRGVLGKRADTKKAIVTLKPGQTIDLTAQV